jgi:hypothetical protein
LIDENGEIVADVDGTREGLPYTPPTFVRPGTNVLDLDTLAGFGSGAGDFHLAAGDRVGVTVYRGSEITNLAAGGFSVNVAQNAITILDPSINLNTATFRIVIARPSVHEAGDAKLYFGNEVLAVGDPVVDAVGNLAIDENGDVLRHTAESIGRNVSEAFSYFGGASVTFTLSKDFIGGYVAVKLSGTELSAAQFSSNATANTVTVTPGAAVVQGSQVIITYRIGLKTHARGEQVFALQAGEFVPVTYQGGEDRLYLGNEPRRFQGGEQAYYTAADPVREATEYHRVLINATTPPVLDATPGEVLFRNVERLNVNLGAGNDLFTVVRTDLPESGASVAVELRTG